MLQLRVTALFYLDNNRKSHPRGMRACRPKDTKRREGAPALWLLCLCFFLAPGLSCVNWAARSAVWSTWGPDSSPQTFLWPSFVLFLKAFPFLVFSVQSLSRVRLFVTPWITACQASLSITNSQSSLKLMSSNSVMPSSHRILCHPLLLLPSIFPSIRVFSNESALCIGWPKDRSFSFNISPSNEHPGLISFRMDWLDHLAVQGTRKSLLQHHSKKASILQCSAFFIVQLSHPYMTTEKP